MKGKIIGYILLILAFVGFGFAAYRYLTLHSYREHFKFIKINSSKSVELAQSEYEIYFTTQKKQLYLQNEEYSYFDWITIDINQKMKNGDLIPINHDSLGIGDQLLNGVNNEVLNNDKDILIGKFNTSLAGNYLIKTQTDKKIDKTAQIYLTQPYTLQIVKNVSIMSVSILISVVLLIIGVVVVATSRKKEMRTIST